MIKTLIFEFHDNLTSFLSSAQLAPVVNAADSKINLSFEKLMGSIEQLRHLVNILCTIASLTKKERLAIGVGR